MALTPLRWMAIAVGAALVMLIGALQSRREYVPTPEEIRMSNLQHATSQSLGQAGRFARQYRTAQLTDSLRRASARNTSPAITTSYGPGVDPRVRDSVESAVAKARARLGDSLRAGVDIVTIMDTGSVFGVRPWTFMASPTYILGTRPGERCIVVLPIGKENSVRYLATQALAGDEAPTQLLGPCAYYAAFGQPGPQVLEWLRRRAATFAIAGSWTQKVTFDPRSYQTWARRSEYFANPPAQFYTYSVNGVRCSVGETGECESAVLDASLNSRQVTVGPAVRPNYSLRSIYYTQGTFFGGKETELLADMVRSLGRDRFARFWTSTEPVPAAFAAASGSSLGEWVSRWAGEDIGGYEPGPRSHPGSLTAGLAVALACVLWAVFASRRRVFV